jgi:hypothetical protein
MTNDERIEFLKEKAHRLADEGNIIEFLKVREEMAELGAGGSDLQFLDEPITHVEVENGTLEMPASLVSNLAFEDSTTVDQIFIGSHEDLIPEEAVKNDSDKVRMELITPEFMFALSAILTKGAEKYDDHNWDKGKGLKWSRCFGAMMRHMWAWWGGKGPTNDSFLFGSLDDEWGFSHLWHAAACLMFMISFEMRGSGQDDRYASH